MADILNDVKNLPDISFIDDLRLEDIQTLLINTFQSKYKQITGKKITLARADPNRVILLAAAQLIYQGLQHIDKAGKMNFLKYSMNDYLENLAALKGVTRNGAKKASVPVLWKLSEARESAVGIPAGTRVTASFDIYFETTEYNEIPAGETEKTIIMTCTEAGDAGNGFLPGELNVLVDPVGFVESVDNTETSSGGSDIEDDESLAERTFIAPSAYSTAGPDDAYIYWVKDFDPQIGDVLPTSPTPGVVDIRFMMDDGSIPDDTEIAGVLEYLQQRKKRPLTDLVQVGAPEAVQYSINARYFINTSSRAVAASIQQQAAAALVAYQQWQAAKIGRDINPDKLREMLMAVGVKRVEITEPVFTVLEDTQVAVLDTSSLSYGGLEYD